MTLRFWFLRSSAIGSHRHAVVEYQLTPEIAGYAQTYDCHDGKNDRQGWWTADPVKGAF